MEVLQFTEDSDSEFCSILAGQAQDGGVRGNLVFLNKIGNFTFKMLQYLFTSMVVISGDVCWYIVRN